MCSAELKSGAAYSSLLHTASITHHSWLEQPAWGQSAQSVCRCSGRGQRHTHTPASLPGDAPRGGAEGPPADAGPLSLAPPIFASCCCIARFRFTCSLSRSRAESMGASPLPPLLSPLFSPTLFCEPFTAVRRPTEASPICRLAAPPTSAPGAILAAAGLRRVRERAGGGPLPRPSRLQSIKHATWKARHTAVQGERIRGRRKCAGRCPSACQSWHPARERGRALNRGRTAFSSKATKSLPRAARGSSRVHVHRESGPPSARLNLRAMTAVRPPGSAAPAAQPGRPNTAARLQDAIYFGSIRGNEHTGKRANFISIFAGEHLMLDLGKFSEYISGHPRTQGGLMRRRTRALPLARVASTSLNLGVATPRRKLLAASRAGRRAAHA